MATGRRAGPTACTIVARNYLPAARVLAGSYVEHHRDGCFYVLVVDDLDVGVDAADEPFEIVRPGDLDLDPDEFLRMAMLYDVTELCTAVKPWLLRFLLDQGAEVVLYLDPDVEVFAPLDELAGEAERHGIALVPHAEAPIPHDGCEPSERRILLAGAYNLGCIAVSGAAEAFLLWWQERLARGCVRDVEEASFVDQRFVDLVPGAFGAAIVRDPTFDVAYWNLHSRPLTKVDGRYHVGAEPLRFFHYSGYSPHRPEVLFSYHHDDDRPPRVLLSQHPVVAEICFAYVAKLASAGGDGRLPPYRFGELDDGTPIDERMRRVYRAALERYDLAEEPEPANPFRDGTPAFLEWIRRPTHPRVAPQVNRYLADLWDEDSNLRNEFPELEPETADAYLGWCIHLAKGIPASVVPSPAELDARRLERRVARPVGARPEGVNVIGYHGAILGLGEVARAVADSLRAAGVDVAAVGNPETRSAQLGDVACVPPADAPYDVNLFVVNADMMPPLAGQLGPGFFAGRRNVGLWFWEVDKLSPVPVKSLQVLDEVWVASEHTRAAVAAVSDKPVHLVPIPIPSPRASPPTDRSVVGLPDDRFVFLMTLDLFSVGERKNPWGLVEAYRSAFEYDDGATLIVKTINGLRRAEDLERLRFAAFDRADILVRDEYFSRDQQAALMAQCDAYVSLHRSEGFGLTMAEAMSLGKPVIATGYSGNMEFMDESVASLVPYTLCEVGPGHHPYPADARWADPDLARAGELMRHVFEHHEAASAMGHRAAARIREDWSIDAIGARLADQVDALRTRSDVRATWREFFMRGWRPLMLGRVHRNYDFDWLPDGTPVDVSMQALFDHALRRARAGRGRPAPDPDESGTDAVIDWLSKPFAPRVRPIVSRYLVQYWHDHPELHEPFPSIETDRGAARAYVAWVRERWHDETDVPRRLVPG
jgi:glycosyltransferase involved in cell wall biosynthesis